MGQSWRGGKAWGDRLALLLPRGPTSLNRMAAPKPTPAERAIALVMSRNWSKNPRDPLGREKNRWGADLSQLSPDFMEKVRGWKVTILAWGYRKYGKLPRVWGIFTEIGWAATLRVTTILRFKLKFKSNLQLSIFQSYFLIFYESETIYRNASNGHFDGNPRSLNVNDRYS